MPEGQSALIVCTLNRPTELKACLVAASRAKQRPLFAVVVSADETEQSRLAIDEAALECNWRIVHEPAPPGLARQRNLGIERVLDLDSSVKVVHFLDDDVQVTETYFEEIDGAFRQLPEAVLIGGRDLSAEPYRPSVFGRIIGTHSLHQGALLRSGYNAGYFSTTGLHSVDWITGCAQSFDLTRLQGVRFDPEIRFYGEEIDMHVRCSPLGQIVFCPDARFTHAFSTAGRDELRAAVMWGDCARWELCRRYPERFSRWRMLWATSMHVTASALRGILPNSSNQRQYARGHGAFLKRLLLRREMRQPVASWLR